MSNIASLEMELSRQRSINNELHNQLNIIASGVSRAHNKLENFNTKINKTLDAGRAHLDESEHKMAAALQTQAEIESLYVRFKAMELANKRIRECNNKKYYDFANYTKVRKLVQGVMDNLDVNMASDRVIYKSVERQHLQTPDYWLTCALLSIMAWRNDDKPLADRAMSLALSLDKKSSSIFFMLFNLRMHREEAALKWFQQYQQCEMKGSDQRTMLLLFVLISRCINADEELDERSRDEITQFISRVVNSSVQAQDYQPEEMVQRIVDHLKKFIPQDQVDYPLMRKYSKEFSKFSSLLMDAKANIGILEYFRSVIYVQPEPRNALIKGFIDELIAAANSEEKQVFDEIEYNELIIRLEGDVDAAKQIFGSKKIHDQKDMNLIYEMIEWVYGADKEDLNDQSRLNMFLLTKNYQQAAIDNRTNAYRSVDRRHSHVVIGDYETQFDFENEANERAKASAFYTDIRDRAIAEIKSWPAFVGFGVGAAAGIAAIPLAAPGMLILTALGAGFGGIKLLLNKMKKKQLTQKCQESIRLADQNIASLCEEYSRYINELAGYDAYVGEIYRELESI